MSKSRPSDEWVVPANLARLRAETGQMRTCRFPLFDSDYNLIGYCLYRELSRINHSCDPNAQIVYPFDSMGKRFTRLIATRDIEDGDEVAPLHQEICLTMLINLIVDNLVL